MLMQREDCALLVVDVQERLLPVIHDWQRLLDNVMWLVRLAQRIGVPIMTIEQYPQGLGRTQADLRAMLPRSGIVEKVHFSGVAAGIFRPDQDGAPGAHSHQLVVCGIETHVCVLQTVLELREQGRQVFVVADAVSSRDPASKEMALERMRRHEIEVVSREMVAFEWLRQAATPLFKEINRDFLR